MTERVVQNEYSERIVYGGSDLWEFCMKTIPEPRAEEKFRSVAVLLRYKQRVKE